MAKQRVWGSGSIYKRGKIYYLFTRVNGKAKMTSLKTANREEAEKKAEEILPGALLTAESRQQVVVHIGEAKGLIKKAVCKLKLDDTWKTYKSNPTRPQSSSGTLANYERCWKFFRKWIKAHYPKVEWLSEITPDIAQDYIQTLGGKSISANTFNYHLGALKLICRVLAEKAGLEANPFAAIERHTGIKQQRKEFTLSEVQSMLAAFDHLADYPNRKPLRLLNPDEMRALFYLLAYSGLRLADACLLKWKSVAKGMITVTPQKTRHVASTRLVHIPICAELARQLKVAREWQGDSEYVLPKVAERYRHNLDGVAGDCIRIIEWNEFKERNRKEKVNNKATEEKSGGRNRRFYGVHSFRHFFASHCAMAGVPVAALADILGDNISTLQRYYIHAGDAARKQVLAALPSQPRIIAAPELVALREQAKKLIENADVQSLMSVIKTLELPKITS